MHLVLAVPTPAFLRDPAGAGPLPPMLSPAAALYLPRSRPALRFLLDATSRMPSLWLLPLGCGQEPLSISCRGPYLAVGHSRLLVCILQRTVSSRTAFAATQSLGASCVGTVITGRRDSGRPCPRGACILDSRVRAWSPVVIHHKRKARAAYQQEPPSAVGRTEARECLAVRPTRASDSRGTEGRLREGPLREEGAEQDKLVRCEGQHRSQRGPRRGTPSSVGAYSPRSGVGTSLSVCEMGASEDSDPRADPVSHAPSPSPGMQ